MILIAPYFPYGKAAWPEGRLFVLICVQALFAGFYAATFKQPFNAIAWSFSALAGYLAVFYLMNIPDVIALNLFTPVVTCVPTLVLLGIEWRLRQQRKAASWIIPPLVIGIFAVIINFLQLFGSRPDQVWMVVAILAGYALFWGWESRSLKTVLWLPWFLSLSCAYAAYLLFWTIPAVVNLNLDVLFVRLPPALLLLGLEWLLRKRAADYSWRVAPLLLGGTAVVINIFPVLAIFPEETWMVTTLLGIYTVFFTLEASWLKNRLSWLPWSIALTSFYAMYLYFWQIPGVSSLHTSGLITSVFPIFLFLSLEWQLRRHGKGKIWTWPALTAGSIALVVNVVAIILAPASDSSLVLINCVLTALLLGAYSFSGIKPVFVYWTFALCFAWVAYWKLFDQHWFLFSTWKDEVKLLPLAVIFLGLDLFLRKRKFERERWLPVLLMGMAAALFNIILALAGGLESHPAVEPALIFAVWGLFFMFYTWLDARPWVGYLVTSAFALTLVFTLRFESSKEWVLALALLAASFYLVGYILFRRPTSRRYGTVFCWSAIILAGILSLTAPVEYRSSGVAGVALAATLYTFEGFKRRSVWWGFPACVLYYMSYSLALSLLKINEPQYFSIGAALLGIIMHYLLLKTSNAWAALIMGILAQLILFGTSYIQMVLSLDLKFFLMLFLQSLALLVYGLIVRSRTLVLMPIVFAILGVVTVTLTILKGLPTALIIGLTGILLLALGIMGLLLRERLVKWVENFKLRLENW